MLRQLQALSLVVRAGLSVEALRPLGHALIDEARHDLPVFEDERHLARAHLQHGAGALAPSRRMAEAWIEEAGINMLCECVPTEQVLIQTIDFVRWFS